MCCNWFCNALCFGSLLPSVSNLIVRTVVQRFFFHSLSFSLSLCNVCALFYLLCSVLLCDLRSISLSVSTSVSIHLSVSVMASEREEPSSLAAAILSAVYLLSLPAVYLILSLPSVSSLSHTHSANVLQMRCTCEAIRSNALLAAAHPMTRFRHSFCSRFEVSCWNACEMLMSIESE